MFVDSSLKMNGKSFFYLFYRNTVPQSYTCHLKDSSTVNLSSEFRTHALNSHG